MRALRVLIIAALPCLAAPTSAAALKTDEPEAGASRPFRVGNWLVKTERITLRVDFAGATGTDCASHGLCDTAGSVTVAFPKGRGLMAAVQEGGAHVSLGNLRSKGTLAATATTGGAGACTDDAGAVPSVLSIGSGGTFVFGNATLGNLAEMGASVPEPFASRCAGPALDDVRAALPRARIPGYWRKSSFKVVLDQTRSFTGTAFGGTVTATGTLWFQRLGRGR